MIKPKVRVLSDDGRKQVIELRHPGPEEFKAVIHHSYVGGKKIDVGDEAQIRELWKAQWERRGQGTGRETPKAPEELKAPEEPKVEYKPWDEPKKEEI